MPETPSVGAGATFRSFPASPLLGGRGAVRELAVDTETARAPRWSLHAVELRSATGRVGFPPDARLLVAGISGPQVALAGTRVPTPIRREGVVSHPGPLLPLERSGFRGAMSTSVALVLAYDAASIDARFEFAQVVGSAPLPADARVLIVLSGSLEIAAATLGPRTILTLPASAGGTMVGTARVVLLRLGGNGA